MVSMITFKNNSDITSVSNLKDTKVSKEKKSPEKTDEVVISTKNDVKSNLYKKDNDISVLRKTLNTFAELQKTYVTIKEGFFGVVSAVTAGLATGAGILSLDWYITRLSGHGDKSQSLFKTPIKTVGKAFGAVGKKLCSVWNMTIKEIVKYPFVGFPKDISKYVKDAKGISKYGKGISIGLGIAASCVSATFSLVKINRARAEVDHGFRIGHNR